MAHERPSRAHLAHKLWAHDSSLEIGFAWSRAGPKDADFYGERITIRRENTLVELSAELSR